MGISCSQPPSVCYQEVGVGVNGLCSYEPADGASCDDGDDCTENDACAGGACKGLPVQCGDPGPPECIEGSILRSYGAGTCSSSGCTYATTDENCPHGCTEGQCNLVTPAIVTSAFHTCALSPTGRVRCWGHNGDGRLGYGHTKNIGDDESPASAGDVDVGGLVTQISSAGGHTCALLASAAVRCWGPQLGAGALGYANDEDIGDDELPSAAGDVDVGDPVKQIAAGGYHTCALLQSGAVRCWGRGDGGALGYGNKQTIGNDETPASVGDVDIGGPVSQLTSNFWGTCALLTSGSVRCWGFNVYGQLGYGHTQTIGDDETPASAGELELGGAVTSIASSYYHTCAILVGGAVRCWGMGSWGATGHGNTDNIGDDETPASASEVDLGGAAVQLAAGWTHTCGRLKGGALRCWGNGAEGQLGYGSSGLIGDDEPADSIDPILTGENVSTLDCGASHTCVRLQAGSIRCWGRNVEGQLGYGNTNNIYDADEATNVPIW